MHQQGFHRVTGARALGLALTINANAEAMSRMLSAKIWHTPIPPANHRNGGLLAAGTVYATCAAARGSAYRVLIHTRPANGPVINH